MKEKEVANEDITLLRAAVGSSARSARRQRKEASRNSTRGTNTPLSYVSGSTTPRLSSTALRSYMSSNTRTDSIATVDGDASSEMLADRADQGTESGIEVVVPDLTASK